MMGNIETAKIPDYINNFSFLNRLGHFLYCCSHFLQGFYNSMASNTKDEYSYIFYRLHCWETS